MEISLILFHNIPFQSFLQNGFMEMLMDLIQRTKERLLDLGVMSAARGAPLSVPLWWL